mmetsp:Transcript_12145/g.27705  ORF Transcript_12145/g.27705 Transcript_12145/m.27705 type:complete len:236 (-) Transcript_12145:228-935(-)
MAKDASGGGAFVSARLSPRGFAGRGPPPLLPPLPLAPLAAAISRSCRSRPISLLYGVLRGFEWPLPPPAEALSLFRFRPLTTGPAPSPSPPCEASGRSCGTASSAWSREPAAATAGFSDPSAAGFIGGAGKPPLSTASLRFCLPAAASSGVRWTSSIAGSWCSPGGWAAVAVAASSRAVEPSPPSPFAAASSASPAGACVSSVGLGGSPSSSAMLPYACRQLLSRSRQGPAALLQ